MLNAILLSDAYVECGHAKCRFAECHGASSVVYQSTHFLKVEGLIQARVR
jgi:hypothetical protein